MAITVRRGRALLVSEAVLDALDVDPLLAEPGCVGVSQVVNADTPNPDPIDHDVVVPGQVVPVCGLPVVGGENQIVVLPCGVQFPASLILRCLVFLEGDRQTICDTEGTPRPGRLGCVAIRVPVLGQRDALDDANCCLFPDLHPASAGQELHRSATQFPAEAAK